MGIASHLSWAHLSYSASYTVSQPNAFFCFFCFAAASGVDAAMEMICCHIESSRLADIITGHGITVTAIIEMQSGQKVSDSLLFYVA